MTKTILTSGVAMATSATVQSIDLNNVAGLVTQLAIAVITIIKLFKNDKSSEGTKKNDTKS